MIKTIYTIVFHGGEGGGNPCPVTLNADELTTEQMQTMTAQFGAESAFLMKPSRPDCDIKARYFLPLHETNLCIHATIGSATVLIKAGVVSKSPILYETNMGPMCVEWTKNGEQIDVCVEQFLPVYQTKNPTTEEVCHALRITPGALAWGPIQSVSTSRTKLMIPLVSKRVLDGLLPDFEFLWRLCERYDTTGFYPFTIGEVGDCPLLYARQFPQRAGYEEDPATGVAAAALAA